VKHRRLGRSGLSVSEISYGNWITHGDQVERDAAIACVRAALDEGITTFDTADIYAGTRAESVLGEALAGVDRSSYELASKVFWPTGPGENDKGLGRKHIMASIDGSLRRLRTDHLDLYQAHRFDPTVPLEETLRAFDDIVRAGKALYIGVSEWSAAQIRDAVRLAGEMGLDRIISNQPQYSALWRVIEADVVPTSRELGISQIVWSPIAQGMLTGKYSPGAAPPAGSRATSQTGAGFISRFMRPEVIEAVAKLRPVAEDAGVTMAQLAVAWVLRNDNVASAIVGASRPEQVRENVRASGAILDDSIVARMEATLAGVTVLTPPPAVA
jgi:aryl-alcohol dehydrogenase-like predicted oxidoreductase